jgi:Tol biopolymer transport system component
MHRRWLPLGILGLLLLLALLLLLRETAWREANGLPADLPTALVYVSDAPGSDTLFERNLVTGVTRRLTYLPEAAREPDVSADGRYVAFSTEGRIGIVDRLSGTTRILTLGVEWRDGSPSWSADGQSLVVSAERAGELNADVHLLAFGPEPSPKGPARRALTETPGLNEASPALDPTGRFVVFSSEDGIYRLDLSEARSRRLTTGFMRCRSPRLLADGRVMFLWSLEKQHGADIMDGDGGNRSTLWQGSVFYRSVAPTPTGRYLAATFTYDLGFHPLDAIKPRQTEALWLLDGQGRRLAVLASSWRFSGHSPAWAR